MTTARVQFKVTLECKALPCEGLYRQGKPCTPECIFKYCPFVRITFNCTLTTHFKKKDYL